MLNHNYSKLIIFILLVCFFAISPRKLFAAPSPAPSSADTTNNTVITTAKTFCTKTNVGNGKDNPPPNCDTGNTCGAASAPKWLNSGPNGGQFPNHPEWYGLQCSGASMAEIFNAYGKNYKIEDVLQKELDRGMWSVSLGTYGDNQKNITDFGNSEGFDVDYKVVPINNASLDDIIAKANAGQPVMVGAPDHWLVVIGGDANGVKLLDSSGHFYTYDPSSGQNYIMTRDHFLHGGFDGFSSWNSESAPSQGPNGPGYWSGIRVIFTPKNNSCQNTGASDDLVKAAEGIKKAYDTCQGGSTYAGNDACINQSLSSGFSASAVDAFKTLRPHTIVGCTQCLGFVGLSLALAYSDSGPLAGFERAIDVLSVGSFTVGGTTYKKIQDHTPQPGDVGVVGAVSNGGDVTGNAGHILIVYKPNGNIKFTAIESNWGSPSCHVSDTVSYHLDENYTFYRKQ